MKRKTAADSLLVQAALVNDDDDKAEQSNNISSKAEKITERDAGLEEPLLGNNISDGSGNHPQQNEDDDGAQTETLTTPLVDVTTEAECPRAIGWAPTTPVIIRILFPILVVSTSVLFYYGQSANMWKLTSDYSISVQYQASATPTRLLLQALKLPMSDTLERSNVWDIQDFTYAYWVHQLWLAQGMPSNVLPRMASVGLVLCSGVWPHLKLLLLLMVWYFGRHSTVRSSLLHWLSVLGKWSLVDVFVVCVLVGILHLQWLFEAETALQQILAHWSSVVKIIRHLYSTEDLCTMALQYSCHDPSKFMHIVDCKACHSAMEGFLMHPSPILNGLTVSGGGHGRLVVKGLHGIYAFCGAVVASILLSAIVDVYDLKHKKRENHIQDSDSVLQEDQIESTPDSDEDDDEERALLVNAHLDGTRTPTDTLFDDARVRSPRFRLDCICKILWSFFSWLVLALVVYASFSITMKRDVSGAMPQLMEDLLGMEWAKTYSFWSLGWTMKGGWDYLMMGTFCCFMIFGPVLRSVLCATVSCLPDCPLGAQRPRMVDFLNIMIDFVGAFCAWEVFAAAAFMVYLLMPDMTETIITDERCEMISSDTCLEVDLDLHRFWKVIGAGMLLLVVSLRARELQRSLIQARGRSIP